ncbi:MAG: holo-ACP synthase [Planctomycetota bacterium]|jgi:holo-[acyl-carrier protein] synthase
MIAGVGLDLVEIERIEGLLERHGDAFAKRILHPDEDATRLAHRDGPAHLAGLFAAKEAVMKALGTGMTGAGFTEIGILRRPAGRPYVVLRGGALARATELGIEEWHVSITHSKTSAAAVAVALRLV